MRFNAPRWAKLPVGKAPEGVLERGHNVKVSDNHRIADEAEKGDMKVF